MKKSFSIFTLFVVFLCSFFIGSFAKESSATEADEGSASYIDVTTITEDGNTVKGSPMITAVPDPKKGPVESVTFYAKAKNESEEHYYPYITQYSHFTWSWPTGNPWVPDGKYHLKMVIHYSSEEVESITREIIVQNYSAPNAPAAPSELNVPSRTTSSATLSWAASTTVPVYQYMIYQDGNLVAETTATSYTVNGLIAGEKYNFQIKIKDIYDNISMDESSVTIIIPSDNENVAPLPDISKVDASGPKGKTPGSDGYSGTVQLGVTAAENVRSVEFFGKMLNDPNSAYQKFPEANREGNIFSVPWDTTSYPEGNAMIKAVATDPVGQVKTVTNVFLVDNVSDFDTDPNWEPADSPPANRVVGYLAGWSTSGSFNILRDLDASRLTHLNYAFAMIGTDLKLKVENPIQDEKNFKDLAELKKKYPHLKTMISVGGWGGSANFSEAAASKESRTIFAESAIDFMIENGFDGIDLDWEYPVTGGGPGTSPNPSDRDNFPLLLEKLRKKLDKQGEKDGKHYSLTIAGGATASFANNTQLGVSQKYLDYVQIMTYDIHGTWETIADFTAPLFDDGGKTYSVDKAIQAYLDAGVPADKLVMGTPFYGYTYNVTSAENNGLRQPVKGSGSITYNRIVKDDLLNNGYKRFWDEGAKVPFLFNREELIFISHEDEQSIGLKAEYIRDRGLGGAMIWELSQDHGNDLLASIYNVLKDPIPDKTVADLMELVKQFEKEGEFTREDTSHSLMIHLIAVEVFEKKEEAQKVVKHMESFKLLLDHQKENKLISEKAYNRLKAGADSLVAKWQ
ncbi:glycosyl hydrolase family 18 protein [Lederbergia sp. NSJ-179]|uniref:glycosyl hydrolase family 18 protein n=1 Tax=Lederbergia sp. NSJ-179 TaxID=2931402 RepID=UPI001FCFD93A|nr:glycosyl hydrolase family 18 protein [Lederbergia sp. NSJ-179]MCJ7841530.1 glycosyl hydrolase family 18 protein [Lederbergia sp. NSJ-179]